MFFFYALETSTIESELNVEGGEGYFMKQYYLAIDIGASSGRHILAHMENGRMVTEEIYRFANQMDRVDGSLVWDVDRLFTEVIVGMKKCAEIGKVPVSVGIDTWAVDYVLVDRSGNRVGPVYAYRDRRTDRMDAEVYHKITEDELYERTGIQHQKFNTIYQLMALKKQQPQLVEQADRLLLIPDYLQYRLTENAVTEYTNATTTQLVSPVTKDWDWDLIRKLGIPKHLFQKIVKPGFDLGALSKQIAEQVGYSCHVVVPATHDTGSAVLAVPEDGDDVLYISSGTWSLMGTELVKADCSEQSRHQNFTNEGGYDYRFRYLKNIMGLWMIQSVRHELATNMGFGEICELAEKSSIHSLVDCNADRFLAPKCMTEEIKEACRETGQQIPEGIGEVAAVIYHSLALCYEHTLAEIEHQTGKRYQKIHIIGGGSNADYLNRLTALKTGRPVYAGPSEATAIGNVAAQMITAGELKDLKAARTCIAESFSIKEYREN